LEELAKSRLLVCSFVPLFASQSGYVIRRCRLDQLGVEVRCEDGRRKEAAGVSLVPRATDGVEGRLGELA
jgi:hypothetical protein